AEAESPTRTNRREDATKDSVLGSHRSRGERDAARRLQLSDRGPRGGRELSARGISPAVACPARYREGSRSHRAALATAADVEGMGLRRLYLHVDRGSRGALSGWRRSLVVVAGRVARVAGGFLRDAWGPHRPPRIRFIRFDRRMTSPLHGRGTTPPLRGGRFLESVLADPLVELRA